MGWFDWLFDMLSGQSAEPVRTSDADATAVATLEPPDTQVVIDRWWAPEGVTATEPQPIARPDLSAEAIALENILVSHFDSHDLTLPAIPRAAEKVIQRLGNRDYDIKKVSRDIEEDQVLAGAVLRMSNSVIYGGRVKIASVHRAVSRLGANALRTLMMHQSLRAAAFEGKGGDRALCDLVWNRSLAGGCVMRCLAPITGIDPEEAFMMGLLHDVGSVVVLREVQKHERSLNYEMDIATFDYLCWETHQEFGELVAENWGLPGDIQRVIARHHEHPTEDNPLRRETLVLMLADMINAMIGFAPAAQYDLLNSRVVHDLQLADREDFEDLLIELPGVVEINVASVSF